MGMKLIIPNKEIYMSSIADSSVIIQSSSENMPCPPPWFGEVALIVEHLRQQGVLTKIGERIRFARRRFGHYEVIDFLAVLFGYAISGERTLQAFYEAVRPFASAFMALFGRGRLPARSTLSRFLAALTPAPVEALRSLFLDDLLARPLAQEKRPANAPCRRQQTCLLPSVGCRSCVLLVTPGASEERSCAPAR